MSPSGNSDYYSSYFVPGYKISRHVMFTNIHYYLGPYASVRPFSYQQREGYLITNPGVLLTRVCLRCLLFYQVVSDYIADIRLEPD